MPLTQTYLSNIQIVMINTTLPANIGSAARAMHTMGLSNLTLVAPKHPVDDSSYAHAAGATHVLDNHLVVNTLEDAIATSQLVFAASSRSRTMPRPVVNPAKAAQLITQFIDTQLKNDDNKHLPTISILFGREDRGLTNDELATASYHIQIDANPHYPVLNVASAVQVISSFIYSYVWQLHNQDKCNTINKVKHADIIHQIRQDWDEPAINLHQQQQLNDRILNLMQLLNLADNDDQGKLPQRLSRLNSRLQLDQKEYQLLNAVVGKLGKLVK